jgi:farnesyl diphosphate synthase
LPTEPSFEDRLAAAVRLTDARLAELVGPGLGARVPERVREAMAYALLGGGKRFRPFLTIEAARLFGGDEERAAAAGAAIECLHTYSLVHDDLPAMDDDDLRRGRPTVHKAFDEATAILAGDGLLTLAFEALADPAVHPDSEVRIALVTALARAAGADGMVGGQALDLAAEGEDLDAPAVERLQAMKTGALIVASAEMGAIVARAAEEDRRRIARFAALVGSAFQLADDLLDVTATAAAVGKRTGKDAERGKATLVALHGEDWARARLAALVAEATETLAPYGARAGVLVAAARFTAERQA